MMLCCADHTSQAPQARRYCCAAESGDGSRDEVTAKSPRDPFEETRVQSEGASAHAVLQLQVDEVLAQQAITFEQHTDKLTPDGRRTAQAVAALLANNPEVALRICCCCGDVAGTEWATPGQANDLSHRQAVSVQAAFRIVSFRNAVLPQGIFVDGRGPRCEISLCSAAGLASRQLDVVFRDQVLGKDMWVAFVKRPLGMDLPHSMPLIVQNVRGQASDLGVQPGWLVRRIGNNDVQEVEIDEAYRIFQAATAPLPEEPAVEQLKS